jgi:hypothetical protein
MPSKFFGNKQDNLSPGSRGKQNNTSRGGNRTNNKRSSGMKKSGRGK